jgi:phosphatidylglycerol lysyltransferase
LLGDKYFLFGESGDSFIMYGIRGRTWISLGDPIGPPASRRELVWAFRELSDVYDGHTVFYEVGAEGLPNYLDLGLSLLKLGEEAWVSLPDFSLSGRDKQPLRHGHGRAKREGAVLSMHSPGDVPGLLPEMEQVSDAWLILKRTREKGFSLGRFDAAYLAHFPVAIVRQNGRMVAFATLFPAADRNEISVDLMRFVPDGPYGIMDYLFVELMLWAKVEKYRWFNLGMAPLSGLEGRRLGPLWSRAGAFIFRHGEQFYNFRGLRHYKAKFGPEWRPKYLAAPGGLALPRVLTDVAALISGGTKGIIAK